MKLSNLNRRSMRSSTRWPGRLAVSVLTIAASLACARRNAPATRSGADIEAESIAQILGAFAEHPIVMLGEQHRSAAFYAFAGRLVSTTKFAETVNDIVLECGNVRYQPLLDRFIAGDSVPRDSLVLVWRNTAQLLTWDSPVYEGFLRQVRAVNAKLPQARRIRVLVGDPPIDWSATKVASDIPRAYGYRDWQGAAVIEKEVLEKNRRVLVIIGGTHLYRHPAREGRDTLPPRLERASLGDALNRQHPGAAYLVETLGDGTSSALATAIKNVAKPGQLIPLRQTPFGAMSGRALFGSDTRAMRMVDGAMKLVQLTDADFPSLADEVDAVLYLGPDSTVLASRDVYDPAYVAEIRRRIVILKEYYGADIWTDDLNEIVGSVKAP
jgi:hypothetical protein